MNNRKKPNQLPLPAIAIGSWNGEIVGNAHAHFGQQTQPGPRPRSVEFSFMTLPVTLTMPDNAFTWPGVLIIMALARIERQQASAGTLIRGSNLPA